jgi:hypothetical protein
MKTRVQENSAYSNAEDRLYGSGSGHDTVFRELHCVETRIIAIPGHQFFMASLLLNSLIGQYENPVCIPDR